jgi:hypothetical protein
MAFVASSAGGDHISLRGLISQDDKILFIDILSL